MHIKPATKAQLNEICRLVHESIRRLCAADHQNSAIHLANWLQARSAEKLADIVFARHSQAFVCVEDNKLIGLAHITAAGQLTLCYVLPGQTGKGVGQKLLAEVERQARDWGLEQITLISTATARPFYLAHAYEQSGDSQLYIGMPGYPMVKRLARNR